MGEDPKVHGRRIDPVADGGQAGPAWGGMEQACPIGVEDGFD
jgi:hypothetical protein